MNINIQTISFTVKSSIPCLFIAFDSWDDKLNIISGHPAVFHVCHYAVVPYKRYEDIDITTYALLFTLKWYKLIIVTVTFA